MSGWTNIFNQAPPLQGDWKITYMANGQAHESKVTFKQQGRALAGQGADDNGAPFVLRDGTVDGKHVHFLKKYIDPDPSKQPVEYTGDLSFENDSDFKDWMLGGHYRTSINGQAVSDKWVAIRAVAEQSADQQAGGQQAQQAQPAPQQQAAGQGTPQNGGAADTADGAEQAQTVPDDIPVSGMYTATYDFNFKQIESRIWLKQNNTNITGDGTDTTTGEYFVIPQGVYQPGHDGIPPSVRFKCHYTKGVHAANTRDLVIKAAVAPGPTLNGETQFGSPWSAVFVTASH